MAKHKDFQAILANYIRADSNATRQGSALKASGFTVRQVAEGMRADAVMVALLEEEARVMRKHDRAR